MNLSSILFLSFLILICSCQETLQVGNKLTEAERNELATRGYNKCISDTSSVFQTFYENSNESMLDYYRNKSWKFEYKKDSTVIETSYFYVWKVTSTAVYLRLKLLENGVTTNYFIKVDATQNQEMVKNVQVLKCQKTYDVTYSSSSLNVNIDEARAAEDATTESSAETDYRFSSSYPAFFSTLDKLRTKRIYDNGSQSVKKTETYDYILTAISDVSQPATYDDATIINRKFCSIKSTAPVAPNTFNSYSLPFDFKSTCVTSDTAGPDGDGDAVEDFDPATDLIP
jgi:hypothetical protein